MTHYQIEERLGGGGMGEVYRARDLRLDRDVALKFLPAHLHADSGARDLMRREARAASKLDHPNVASVHEIGETADGRLFIAMGCYRGETLDRLIARRPLDPDAASAMALQIADGLAHAHGAGIVHRDVKPTNVMVTDDGRPVVLDFGISQTATAGSATHTTSGTAAYMSPEQAQGAPTDARTDVWGLGVVFYEMLTGRRPFTGSYSAALLYAVTQEPHLPLGPKVPSTLAEIVDRCLAKDAQDRFADAGAVAHALREARGERAARAAPPLARVRAWVGTLHGGARAVLAAAVVAAFVGLGALAWWAGSALSPSASGEQRLAVLPFRTLGDHPDAESISAGLVETLSSQINQLSPGDGSLWVIPASVVSAGLTPRQAREQLGATIVVDGTVQFEDESVRVTFNLIDTSTLRQVASGRVDQSDGEALALQDRTVLQLARLLEVNVGAAGQERLLAGGTADREANALYLRGRGTLRNGEPEEAARLFRQALGRDPSFALAHAALGESLWSLYGRSGDVGLAAAAVRHSERALALDGGLAPVHVSLGVIHKGQQEFGLALDSFDRALDIDPNNVEAARLRAGVLSDQGRDAEAEAAYRAAVALRPSYWRTYNSLGIFYYLAGRNDEAVATYRQGLALAPSNPRLLNSLGAAFWEMGRFDDATGVFEQLRRVQPDHESATANLATAHFYLGRYPQAAALYAEELGRYPDRYDTRQYLGDALWWTPGRRDDARAAFRRSIRSAWAHLGVARSPEVIGTLASAYAKLGVRDSALVYLGELRSGREPDDVAAETAFAIGETYELVGDRPAARRWIQSALDRDIGRVMLDHSPWLTDVRVSLTTPTDP